MIQRTARTIACCVLLTISTVAQIRFNARNYPTGQGSDSVAIGDFDRDGRPDFAAAAYSESTISIYRNTGSGNFELQSLFAFGNPTLIRTADMDGDGNLDLIVTTDNDTLLRIYHNEGDGHFSYQGHNITLGYVAHDFEPADMNNDGRVDIVSHECVVGGFPCWLRVYRNRGGELFLLAATLVSDSKGTAYTAKRSIAVADFSRDGQNDIALLYLTGFGVFTNRGSFTFSSVQRTSTTFPPVSIAAGSFNRGDTSLDLDIATGSGCTADPCKYYAAVYLNDNSGHFPSVRSRTAIYGRLQTVADVNGDGIMDIVGLSRKETTPGTQQYILGNGDGTFKSAVTWGNNDEGLVSVARDLNLDGRHDIVYPDERETFETAVAINTNSAVLCAPPSSSALHAKICAPGSSSTVSKTFTVRGSGNSPAGVKRLELWIDGTKRATAWNDQLKATVTVSAGQHRVAIVAVDQFKGTVTKAISVNAQ
jgi:hypothetical protein